MAANPSPISNKQVTRAMNRANQLDRTKCMAGKRSPNSFVGRNRIILRGTSKVLDDGSVEGSAGGFPDLLDGIAVFIFLMSRVIGKQVQLTIALVDNRLIVR